MVPTRIRVNAITPQVLRTPRSNVAIAPLIDAILQANLAPPSRSDVTDCYFEPRKGGGEFLNQKSFALLPSHFLSLTLSSEKNTYQLQQET